MAFVLWYTSFGKMAYIIFIYRIRIEFILTPEQVKPLFTRDTWEKNQ